MIIGALMDDGTKILMMVRVVHRRVDIVNTAVVIVDSGIVRFAVVPVGSRRHPHVGRFLQ